MAVVAEWIGGLWPSGATRERLPTAFYLVPHQRNNERHSQHAIAEALHVELAQMAFPVRGLGLLPADLRATPLRERCGVVGPRVELLRSVALSGECNERKQQQDHPHLVL